jgi:hypothetical protein
VEILTLFAILVWSLSRFGRGDRVITTARAVVYSGPGPPMCPLLLVPAHTEFIALGEIGDWAKVQHEVPRWGMHEAFVASSDLRLLETGMY